MSEEVLQLSFRWTHLVAGVLWVGLTYALAWVLPRPPEGLADRLEAWLRHGSLVTWLAGISLLMLLYYSGRYPYYLDGGEVPVASDWLPALAALILGFALYDLPETLAERRGSAALAATGPWLLLLGTVGFVAWLERAGVSRRGMYVHAGAFLGTAMVANVWQRIAPALRRGELPLLRARHNARLSIPLLLLMVSVDQPTLLGQDPWSATLAGVLALGYAAGCLIERALP